MKRIKIDATRLDEWLEINDLWRLENNSLRARLEFTSFPKAISFMSSMIPIIEEMDHHPVWTNVYNILELELSTHDLNGISGLDLKLADSFTAAYSSFS